MARIDMERRAEIGRERRERTRGALLSAAKRVFAESPLDAVSVDAIVVAAGVAKGTFYYHFRDLDAIVAAIGEDVAVEFDELLQARRLMFDDPLERFACSQLAFFRKAVMHPRWGRLIRRACLTADGPAASVREHMAADLAHAREAGATADLPTPFALRLLLAMAMEFLDQLDGPPHTRPTAQSMVEAMLRTLGIERDAAAAVIARVSPVATLAVSEERT